MRAATAGTVAPSHLLLTFGKLTTKFETLCKKLKVRGFKISAGRRAGSGDAGVGAEKTADDWSIRAGAGGTAGARGVGAFAVLPVCASKKTRLPTAALFAIYA